ncbi:MAG: hypothetical protein RLO50_22445 [Azospirillaceae bacterium]
MACINPDGTLTAIARAVLGHLAGATKGITPGDLAAGTGLPLYRARASLRELGAADLVAEHGGGWRLTGLGREALEIDLATPIVTSAQSRGTGQQGA